MTLWACSESHPHPCNAEDWTGPACPVLPCGSGVAAAHVCCQPATVKRPDLFGNVNDTYQTEAELNGWRQKQGSLL